MSNNEIKPVAWVDLECWRATNYAGESFFTDYQDEETVAVYDQSAIDRLTDERDAARYDAGTNSGVVATLQQERLQLIAERDAAVADAHRWRELCRQLDAGTFPSIVIDDAMAMGSGALELQVDAALAQEVTRAG